MPRVKRGVQHSKRRRNILKHVKGHRHGRKALLKLAKTAETKAGVHAYRGRKLKKREFRGLWQVRINAAARAAGMSYSSLMGSLKAKHIVLNRKMLAQIAEQYPEVFKKIVGSVK